MVYLLIIAALILAIVISSTKKEKTQEEEQAILGDESELKDFIVTYNDGKFLENKEIIETEEDKIALAVKGIDDIGNEVETQPGKISWHKSCACVKLSSETGNVVRIKCANKGKYKRNMWIKYDNTTFKTFKVCFKKKQEN